nr:mRNA-capping enzyme-like isoform X2 [Tanacetum cinerariifolium]
MLSSVMADDLNMKLIHLENRAKLAMDLANGSSVKLKVVTVVQIDSSSRNIPNKTTNILLDHGWLDCPPYGNALNLIIPLKVLLKESVNEKIVIEKRCSPQQAILQRRRVRRELGIEYVTDIACLDNLQYRVPMRQKCGRYCVIHGATST